MIQRIREKQNLQEIWITVIEAFIFIYSAFFTKLTYLDLNMLGILMVVLTLAGMIIEGKTRFDLGLLFLFQAMFVCCILDDYAGNSYEVTYGWILVSAYIIGKIAIGNDKNRINLRFVKAYFCMAVGLLFTGIVDLIYNYRIGYFDTEWIYSIWSKETVGRTVYDLYGFLMVTSVAYLILCLKKHIVLVLIALIPTCYYLFEMIRYEGRYCLFALILIIPMTLLIIAYSKWDNWSGKVRENILKMFVICMFVLLILGTMYKTNLFGLKDAYKNSYLSGSGGILHNERFEYAWEAIKNIPTNIHGGYGSGLPFGAHNAWLEFGSSYGVIVLVLLVIFKIIGAISCFRIFINKNVEMKIKCLLVPSFILLNIYYSMEPIGFRRRLYFVFILLMFGMVRRFDELACRQAVHSVDNKFELSGHIVM